MDARSPLAKPFLVACLAILTIGILANPAAGATTARVSVASDGTQGDGSSYHWRFAFSRLGRFVVFESEATNLVADDANAFSDVFVRDRNADHDSLLDEPGAVETIRVSVSTDGAEGNSGTLGLAAISGSGRSVAFTSAATNLVDADTNDLSDVFVRERDGDRDRIFDEAGTVRTVRVSVASGGEQGNGESQWPGLSGTGRFITFASSSSNLVAGDTNNLWDVFVHDRDADRDKILDEAGAVKTRRLSRTTAGVEANGDSFLPSVSRNGRFVAFQSDATNLVPDDTNFLPDVFVRDRDTDRDGIFDERGAVKTVRVSLSSAGAQHNRGVFDVSISARGRFVTFVSSAATFVVGDTGDLDDIFVRDRDSDRDGIFDEPGAVATVRVNLSTSNDQANGQSRNPSISGSGRFVVFDSLATNLIPNDANASSDVFLRDRDTDRDGIFDEPGAVTTTRISLTAGGAEVGGNSNGAVISPSGRWALFETLVPGLVPDDVFGGLDVFVRGPLP